MNKKTKKRMLMLSFVFLVLWATATWASNDVLKVQSILGTAIQDIQKIYFSSWAVRDPAHPETEILMNLQNGSVHMWGRMMMAISWANDRMGKLSTWSSLFQGRNNTISWANSFLVWWSWNTIEQDASWSAILWGTSNKIIKGIASYILWGNKNTISGDNSFIIGGVNNKIEWNNSYIFGFTGVKINANNSVAFWKNIEIEKDNVFMWNGTTNKESASRENTFVMYAKNWLIIKDASNITVTKNNSTWALNVADWIMQISWEAVHCWPAIQGAIQYTWWAFGCFCGCNGTGWVSMTPTQKCRNLCPTIDGFSWDGALCKYSEYDERDSLTKAEACEAWNSSDIQEVTSSYFWEDYVSGWQWTCEDSLWGDTVSCSTKRKLVKGRCWSTLNSCAWEWVLDTTSIRFVNHKNIWECLPVWYPVYWVEGWWETNTKQICSLCEDGYKNLKDASGNRIKDSDWSIKCFKIEGTSCRNDVTITTDWNDWCTSWGVAKSTSTDANWNKTWNCESPTGSLWEKFCHTCNASANYVWSWWTTNKCVLKKKWQCGEKAQFASNNKNTWCKVWSVEVVTENSSTQSYAWYCKWENAWDEAAFKSDLCTWCPTGKTYNVESKKCESDIVMYTVTFKANWWSWITTGSVSVQKDTVLNLKNYTGSKSWHDFVWWNTNSWATTAISNPTVVSNMTLYAIFKAKTTPSCTEYAWSSYGWQKCTSNSKWNPCSGVDISHLWYSHSANKCTNFHELCCYNEGWPTEQELICACAVDATAPTTNTLHFIPYWYFDNTLQWNGTMSDQVIECGKSFKINKNQFTKDWYLLLDWNAVDRDEDNFLMDLNDEHYVSGDMLEDFEDFIDNRCGITIDLYAEWTKKWCWTANEKSYNWKPANNLLCSAWITPTNQSENWALYTWKCEDNYCGACTNGFSYNNHCAGVTHNSTAKTITITDGSTSITIQDRNLWATAAWTWVYLWWSCPATFGKYYRWWNNIWFSCKASRYSTEVQDYLDYRNNYNLLYWEINGVKRVEPCPSWYHVPSKEEWDNLQRLWYNMAEFKMHNSSSSEYLAKHTFMDDFLLPSVYEKTVDWQWDISNITFWETKAYYMTSSFYKHPIYNTYMPILAFMDREHTYNDNFIRLDTEGCSNSWDCWSLFAVRCFKD